MAVGGTDLYIMADDDAIKSGNRARGMETFGGAQQPVMVKGKLAQRAAVRPLVEIPHHHRWHIKRVGINRGEQCADLLTPP